MLGDSTSLAGLKKQLAVSVPLTVHEEKLKEKEAVSEERRLENARLAEENKRLREAEKQKQNEVETLRMNGEDLRLKLMEAVNAHDETVKAARERKLEHEQLVSGLVSEVERVNKIILGETSSFFLCPIGDLSFLILLA